MHFFGDLLPVANGGGATPALHGLSSQDDYSQSFDRAFRARNGAIGVAHRDETWGIGALWSPGSSSSFVMRTAMWAGVNDNQWPDALGFITSGAATYPFPHLAAPLGALLHPYHVVAETAAGVQIAGTIPGVEVIMHDRPFGARQIVGNTGASGVVDSVSLPLDYYDGAAVEGQILVNLGGDWYAD